jgi:hypothetical protein
VIVLAFPRLVLFDNFDLSVGQVSTDLCNVLLGLYKI